jgi:hypothetical protein
VGLRGIQESAEQRSESGLHQEYGCRIPALDGMAKKFYWCTPASTFFQTEPFGDDVEGFFALNTCVFAALPLGSIRARRRHKVLGISGQVIGE